MLLQERPLSSAHASATSRSTRLARSGQPPFPGSGDGRHVLARICCAAARTGYGSAVGAHWNQSFKTLLAAITTIDRDGHTQLSLAPVSSVASVPCCVS